MFHQLQKIHARLDPFEHYTAADLWTDEHISSKMLAYHLDGSVDISSRKTEFIDKSVDWMVSRFDLGKNTRVADFGCGPGLYTTRLAAAGASVTGIDFSMRSIEYARKQAGSRGLAIDHVHADYLEYQTEKRFDLITMIMCDFCALGSARRRTLLDKIFGLLAPEGWFLFDAYSLRAFEQREEATTCAFDLMNGFWSPDPYFGFVNTFKYETEKVILDKYTIVEQARTRVIYNWLQYFSHESLTKEVESRGFVVEEFLGDVAGMAFDSESDEFALIAKKPALA